MRIGLVALAVSSAALASAPGSEARLVEDARAALDVSFQRPSPCEKSLEGTFASQGEPHLARFHALVQEFTQGALVLPDEFRGPNAAAPDIATLSPEGQRFVDQAAPHVEAFFDATCAADGALPEAFSLFNVMAKAGPGRPIEWIDIQEAMRIAAIDAGRPSPDRGRRQWRTCIRGLSVARDLSRGILLSRMVGLSVARMAVRVCESAINQASEPELATAARELGGVLNWAPFAKVLEYERLFGQLLFDASLSDSTKHALPTEARRLFADAAESEFKMIPSSGVRMFLFGSWARRKHYAQMTEMIRAAQLPPRVAAENMGRLVEDRPLAYTLLGTEADPDFRSLLLRDAEMQTLLVLLQAAARARHFRLWSEYDAWPPNPMDGFDLTRLVEFEVIPEEQQLTFRIANPVAPDQPSSAITVIGR